MAVNKTNCNRWLLIVAGSHRIQNWIWLMIRWSFCWRQPYRDTNMVPRQGLHVGLPQDWPDQEEGVWQGGGVHDRGGDAGVGGWSGGCYGHARKII